MWKNPGRQVCAELSEPGGARLARACGPPFAGAHLGPRRPPGTWLGAGNRQGSDGLVRRPWGGGFGGVTAIGGEEARVGDGFQQHAGALGPVVELPSPLGREGCRCPKAVAGLPEDMQTLPHCGPPASVARCPPGGPGPGRPATWSGRPHCSRPQARSLSSPWTNFLLGPPLQAPGCGERVRELSKAWRWASWRSRLCGRGGKIHSGSLETDQRALCVAGPGDLRLTPPAALVHPQGENPEPQGHEG